MAKGLPEGFDPEGRNYRIYEGVDYEIFWENTIQSRIDCIEQGLVQRLLSKQGRRLIDLGGGFGRLISCYVDRYEQVVLLDGSLTLLQQAREKSKGRVFCVAGNIQHIPFRAAAFDGALLVRVIQHIHDLHDCFREVRRILSGRGHLIFSYHNKRNLKQILGSFFFPGHVSPFDTRTQELSKALLSHHPENIRTILARNGFSAATDFGVGVLERVGFRFSETSRASPVFVTFARILGRLKLSPWVISKTYAEGNRAVAKAEALSELLQCPVCAGALTFSEHKYACRSCHKLYPVIDGIPDFRI